MDTYLTEQRDLLVIEGLRKATQAEKYQIAIDTAANCVDNLAGLDATIRELNGAPLQIDALSLDYPCFGIKSLRHSTGGYIGRNQRHSGPPFGIS